MNIAKHEMPSFLSKIKALASPSMKRRNAKSHNDLSEDYVRTYMVKEKDLPKLHLAAWRGDMTKVAEFCRADKINMQDKEGRTPLHLAVAGNHKLVANYLINEDAKFHFLDRENRTVFILATMNGNSEILRLLLSSCKEKEIINTVDKKKNNALHYAIYNEKAISLMRILLDCNKTELNHRDKDGNTVLHVATKLHNYEAVQLLIQRQADIDAVNNDQATPLILAAEVGDEVLVKFFIENGCDKNIKDKNNKTAEDYASRYPTCLNVLHGLNQFKAKSSSGKYKKTDKPATLQNARRASWNDASFSEILETNSKAENKFENLFAAAAIANPNGNDIDTDSDASQIEVSVPHHDDPLTARSEKLYSWNDDSDVQNIKANKSTEFPKTAALSSFIANLGVGYESASRVTLASLKSDSSKNNKNNSWVEESIILNSPKTTNKSDNYDSLFKTSADDNQTKKQDKNSLEKQKSKKDDNSWQSDSLIGGRKSPVSTLEDKLSSLLNVTMNDNVKKNATKTEKRENSWFVTIYTSNIRNAGTDARVFVKVFGTTGKTEKFWLDKEEYQDKLFEKASCDKFLKTFPEIGEPKRITIGHDNSGPFPGWHLDKVVLDDIRQKKQYEFKCARWLAKNEGDGKIEVDLQIEEEDEIVNSWNSSGDEDSRMSTSKIIFRQTPTKHVDLAIENSQTTQKRSVSAILASIKNDANPFVTDTSWKKPQAIQEPPQISDVDDELSITRSSNNINNKPATSNMLVDKAGTKKNWSADNLTTTTTTTNNIKNLIASTMQPHKPTIGNNNQTKKQKDLEFSDSDDSENISAIERELILSKTALTNPINFEKYLNNKPSPVNDSQVTVQETTPTNTAPSNFNGKKSTFSKSSPSLIETTPYLNALVLSLKQTSTLNKSDQNLAQKKGTTSSADSIVSNKTTTGLPSGISHSSVDRGTPALNALILNLKKTPSTQSKQSIADDSGLGGSIVDKTKTLNSQKSIRSISSNIDELVMSLSPKKKTWDRIRDIGSDLSSPSDDSKSEKLVFNSSNKQGIDKTRTTTVDKTNDNTVVSTFNPKKDPKQIKGIKQLIYEMQQKQTTNTPPKPTNDSRNTSPKTSKGFSQLGGNSSKNSSPKSSIGLNALLNSVTKPAKDLNAADSRNTSPTSAKSFSNLSSSIIKNPIAADTKPLNQVSGIKELIGNLKKPTSSRPDGDHHHHDDGDNDNESYKEYFNSEYEESMELAIDIEPPPNFQKTDHKLSSKEDGNTSDSEIFMHNLNVLSKAHRQKSISDKNLKLLSQQVDQKQIEIMRLQAQLHDMTSQKQDLEFRNTSLVNQIKIANEEKSRLEVELRKAEQKLIEREKSHLDVMNASVNSGSAKADTTTNKANLTEIITLRKEILTLKEEKAKVDSRIAATNASTTQQANGQLMATLSEQNDKLGVEIKALKHQIDELNKDRNSLSQHKEQLTVRLDESEMTVIVHQEALEKAVMQYSMEKAVLKDEIQRLKADMNDANEAKKRLADDFQKLQLTVKECKIDMDRLLREKAGLEKQLEKERNEKDGVRSKYDSDSVTHKEHHMQLVEKMSANESKLMAVELEYNNAKSALHEKQNQVEALKDDLIKLKVEFNLQESKLNNEREERIRLATKNETIEERLRALVDENNAMRKQHQDYLDGIKIDKLNSVSLASLERRKNESENEKNMLKQDLNILNQRLHNAELELNNQKNLRLSHDFEKQDVHVKQAEKEVKYLEIDNSYLEESKKLKNELEKLRNDFQTLLDKYETNKETEKINAVNETEQKYNDLINKINHSKLDLQGLIASVVSRASPAAFDSHNYHNHVHNRPHYPSMHSTTQVGGYNRMQADPNHRTTIIVPNCEIIIPNGNINPKPNDYSPTKAYASMRTSASPPLPSSHSTANYTFQNIGSCDKCTNETHAYTDMLRSEIAKAIEISVAKEVPFGNLNYKSSAGNLDYEYDYRNPLHDTYNNIELMNSLRTKYFL